MFENNNRVDRFAIRKLTVGVASVLIGVCFLGGNVNTVNADPIGGDAQTEESVKTDEPAKPVVEAGTDEETKAGSDRDAGTVETEQGQQKDADAKPIVDEEPAAESDNSGDAEDGASEGKGLDHVGDTKKDETGTASSDDNKAVIAKGDKAKENDDEANEKKNEEHGVSDKDDSGDELADSKIMSKMARVPKRVKKDLDDPTFKIPAGVKTGHDDKGDYYIEHADVEREFNMWLNYADVQVTLDDKGLFATGYKVVNDKDFLPSKKVYTLNLHYSGDRYYYDENGVTEVVRGDWIVDDYNFAPELKNQRDIYCYNSEKMPEKNSKYKLNNNYDDEWNYNYNNELYDEVCLYSSGTIINEMYDRLRNEHPDFSQVQLREAVEKILDSDQSFFPVIDGTYFLTPYDLEYDEEEDENGNIKFKPNEIPLEDTPIEPYFGAKASSTDLKYGVSAQMGNGSQYNLYLGFPHVLRPTDDSNQSVDLSFTINYYEMPKAIAIDKNGNRIQSLNSLSPRGIQEASEAQYDTVEKLEKVSPLSVPCIINRYTGKAVVNLSNWYDSGYHMADLGSNVDCLQGQYLDYSDKSNYIQGIKNFARKNGINLDDVQFYGGFSDIITEDKKGISIPPTNSGYGLCKILNCEYYGGGATGPIFIVMAPNDQTNTVIVRDSKTGKDLEKVSIAGKTDETVPVNLTFPEKYVLHDGYKWITDYTFKGGSQKPVIILVDPYEHKKGDPLIDDKPEFPLPKPEKKPDDKPKTPEDKPKTPDKVTVPDIIDVPEPAPVVITKDEPKEPKGENIDETLTTGIKGQDVTKPKQNSPVKPMAQDIKQPKQPVVQKVAPNTPKATLPQTGERSSILLSVLGGLVALTGLLYLDKDRKNKKA